VVEGERISPAQVTRRLAAFLEPTGEQLVRFRNQCHRHVAYETLPFRRRRELHARAGDAIERLAGDALVDRAGVLSFHFLHAQQYDRSWLYARMAAEHARAKYANVEALDLYERALKASAHLDDVPTREVADTWEALGDVAIAASVYDRARIAYARARRLHVGAPELQAQLYAHQAATALWQGNVPAATRYVRSGLKLVQGSNARFQAIRSQLEGMFGQICQRAGKHDRALMWCHAAIEDGKASGNHQALASAYRILDWTLIELGRMSEATYSPLALAIWEELGEVHQQAQVLATLGVFAYWQGQWNEAVTYNQRAGALSRKAGNLADAATVATNAAETLVAQGRHDEAEPMLREAIDTFRSIRHPSTGEAVKCLGLVAVRRGDLAAAVDAFTEAAAMARATGEMVSPELDGLLADCRLRQGDAAGALELIDGALRREAASDATLFAPLLRRLRGYALTASGHIDQAWAEFDMSLAVARARDASYEIALTLEAISAVAALAGLPGDPAADEERGRILAHLGVRSTLAPPIALDDPDFSAAV
jgi:tetratricopeptide (TPR) repeat protein